MPGHGLTQVEEQKQTEHGLDLQFDNWQRWGGGAHHYLNPGNYNQFEVDDAKSKFSLWHLGSGEVEPAS